MGKTALLLRALRPVTFRFKRDGREDEQVLLQYGLIAEEVARILPTLVSYDDEGRPDTVRYSLLTPLLLNEVQRQERELAELRDSVAELRRRLDKHAKRRRARANLNTTVAPVPGSCSIGTLVEHCRSTTPVSRSSR